MRSYLLFFVFFYSFVFAQEKQSLRQKDSVTYYLSLAKVNIENNNTRDALQYSEKAIQKAIADKNVAAQANAYSSFGSIYYKLRKYEDAIAVFKKSIPLYNTLKQDTEAALCYYNLGLCYIETNEYESAETHFDKAKSLYEHTKTPYALMLINLQKGIIYQEKQQYELASSFFNAVIAVPNIQETYKASAFYQLGSIELKLNKTNSALYYLNRALAYNSKNENRELSAEIYKSLSIAYEKKSDPANSLFYLKKNNELRNCQFTQKKEKLEDRDYAKFKESKELKTISKIKIENQHQERTNKFTKLISILAIALISILSLLSLSLYKNNIIRTRSNLLLNEVNTELKVAKENAEKASKARTDFLSIVSHELRTPLNAINGITHLLLEENPKKSQLKYLETLQFSGNYLLTFINDILEINRIESNTVKVEYINFNLKILLENIQCSLKEIASDNNNKYILDIDQAIPNDLIGDPTKLSQVFMNLINNALKFTKNGEVKIIAKLHSLKKETVSIYFEIIDTGIGIPEDKLDTIFESFSQGSIEINRKYGGTGLGLSIVKKLIDILGGKIKLESKVGQGSSFSFDLKFKLGKKAAAEVAKNYDESVFENKKILLVEDNKINQMITQKMLENKKTICEIVENGEDAIEKARNNHYDLILMDVHLPGINGTDATKVIRTFNNKTPIIALTAISLNENREMLLSYGMNDVITKPFEPNNFYEIIAQKLS